MPYHRRVLIAAPPGLMRRSLRAVLATFSNIVLIGEADECLSAQDMTQRLQPDILILATGLPAEDVGLLLRRISGNGQIKPYTVVFVNTSRQKHQALAAGADAVLWQSDSTRQIADILKRFQTPPALSQSGIY